MRIEGLHPREQSSSPHELPASAGEASSDFFYISRPYSSDNCSGASTVHRHERTSLESVKMPTVVEQQTLPESHLYTWQSRAEQPSSQPSGEVSFRDTLQTRLFHLSSIAPLERMANQVGRSENAGRTERQPAQPGIEALPVRSSDMNPESNGTRECTKLEQLLAKVHSESSPEAKDIIERVSGRLRDAARKACTDHSSGRNLRDRTGERVAQNAQEQEKLPNEVQHLLPGEANLPGVDRIAGSTGDSNGDRPNPALSQAVPETVKVFGPGAYAHYLNIALYEPNLVERNNMRYSSSVVRRSGIESDHLKLKQPQGLHPLQERIYTFLNSSDPIPSPERPSGVRPVIWPDGTQVWITPFTREMRAYGFQQSRLKEGCILMAAKSVLHRQIDPEKRNPKLREEELRELASAMGARDLPIVYNTPAAEDTYTYLRYVSTPTHMLPDVMRSFGCDSQYIGIRCQLQDLNQISRRAVEVMGLLHSEGHDIISRVAGDRDSQVWRDAYGKSVLVPSEAVETNNGTHTVDITGFAYRYEKERTFGNELVGIIANDSDLGFFGEKLSNSDGISFIRHPSIGAGIAIDKRILESDLFTLIPPDLRLRDGYDCVAQLVVTEQAIPRF